MRGGHPAVGLHGSRVGEDKGVARVVGVGEGVRAVDAVFGVFVVGEISSVTTTTCQRRR